MAIIIPILKAGEPPSEVTSYQPISLTSCVVKLLERMLADRLYYLAETKNLFSHFQAGFRKGRSSEDQVLRIVQAIEDGFQKKPMNCSVLVLLDFSKAYNTVWRKKLLLHILDIGIPLSIICWLRSLLEDQQARVQLFNILSKSHRFHQRLPHGSVLLPPLFHFYINDLATHLSQVNNAIITLFADDVSILSTARKPADAEQLAQEQVSIVSKWSIKWKLNLNATKSEVLAFSTWLNDKSGAPRFTSTTTRYNLTAHLGY